MFYVYVIQSTTTGRFYIGSAEDVTKRLTEHNNGEVKSTKGYKPWEIVYTEPFDTRSEAIKQERRIKNWKNPGYMIDQLRIGQ